MANVYSNSPGTHPEGNVGTKRENVRERRNYRHIEVRPYAPNLGAEVRGIDLADGLTVDQFTEVHQAHLDHQVLFFKGQSPIAPATQIAIGRMFGELHFHPAAPGMDGFPEVFEIHAHAGSKIANGEFWHSDVSCDELPPLGTMLQIHILPESGGDTMFADSYAAWDALSDPLKAMLEGLTCTHNDARGALSAEHPVVRVQPGTGRKSLFVNKQFSRRIPQLSRPESQMLLAHLFRWQEQVRLSCRWRWSTGDVVIWDERFTLHSVVDDTKERRLLHRATVLGDEPPLGVPDAPTWPEYERNKMASSGYFGIGGYEF